jgi:hypothetical protein
MNVATIAARPASSAAAVAIVSRAVAEPSLQSGRLRGAITQSV